MSSPRYLIAQDLRERISSGEYPPGSHLPTRLDLADRYHVHVGTIQHALDILRGEDVIGTIQGSHEGALVLKLPEREPTVRELAARLERVERHLGLEAGT